MVAVRTESYYEERFYVFAQIYLRVTTPKEYYLALNANGHVLKEAEAIRLSYPSQIFCKLWGALERYLHKYSECFFEGLDLS